MRRIHSFEPIAAGRAHTLILGSMPSAASLAEQRYYAHPRNAFWPILTRLLNLPGDDYAQRASALAGQGYAVWDVLQSCRRPGSLDAAIEPDSVVVNDFAGFLGGQAGIERIFFNGAAAERLFRRHALATLPDAAKRWQFSRLPSTSPAHAGMSFERKLAAWRAILPPSGLAFGRG